MPDFRRVLGDGAVTGKIAGTRDVQDGLLHPRLLIGVELEQPPVRRQIGREVRQVHVMVPILQGFAQGLEDAGFVAAEMVGEDQVQRLTRLRFVVVMPARRIPAAAGCHLIGGLAEQEEVLLVSAPFIMNFMLLVPLAS